MSFFFHAVSGPTRRQAPGVRVGGGRGRRQGAISDLREAHAPARRAISAVPRRRRGSGRPQPRGVHVLSSAVQASHPSWGAELPSVERNALPCAQRSKHIAIQPQAQVRASGEPSR